MLVLVTLPIYAQAQNAVPNPKKTASFVPRTKSNAGTLLASVMVPSALALLSVPSDAHRLQTSAVLASVSSRTALLLLVLS